VNLGSNDITQVSERDGLLRVVALQRTLTGLQIGLARIGKREAQ